MKAKIETMLTDTPVTAISAMAPRNETGIPRLTQKARRSSRNSASTPKTSTNPAAPLRSMIDRRSFSTSAWSCQTVKKIPSGIRACARST